jgi:hypothetical protein
MTYPPQQPYGQGQGQPPQQPYGYGQQQPYPQQQQPYGYGPPQGYPPQKKNKTGLIVGIVIGAVVVLGGGATALILVLNGGSSSGPGGDPAAAAQKYADAVNAHDGAAVRGLACTPMTESDSKAAGARFAEFDLKVKVTGPSGTPTDREAYFWLDADSVSANGVDRVNERLMLPVRADGSRWCVGVGALGMPD